MAKSTNKIRERDIDEQLLISLRTGTSSSSIQDMLAAYMKKNDPILASQLDETQLQALLEDLGFLPGDITLERLDSAVIQYIQELISTSIAGIETNNDTTTLNDQVTALQTLVSTQQSTIDKLVGRIETLEGQTVEVPSLKGYATETMVKQSIEPLQTKVDSLDTTVTNLIDNTISKVNNDIITIKNTLTAAQSNISELQKNFTSLTTKVNALEQKTVIITEKNLDPTLKQKIDRIDTAYSQVMTIIPSQYLRKPVSGAGFVQFNDSSDTVTVQSPLVPVYIALDQTAVDNYKSFQKSPILDVSQQKLLLGDWNEVDGVSTYEYRIIIFSDNMQYDGCSFLNIETETLDYVYTAGQLHSIKGTKTDTSAAYNPFEIITQSYTLVQNESVTINRLDNLIKLPMVALLKDTNVASPTYGHYYNDINNAIIMDSLDTNTTIINTSTETIEILVIVPQPNGLVI